MTMANEALSAKELELLDLARQVRENAYAPYSNFKVGAALVAANGEVFTGCNVENSSYGMTICAERSALVQAISAGQRQFTMIAVVAGDDEKIVTPCGACRQFMAEFTPDFPVLLQTADPSNPVVRTSVNELLPGAFRFADR